MRYDVTLKDLFQQVPQQLIQTLVGCPIREVLTVEYPAVKTRRPDLVARLANDRLYHLEFQTNNDPTIAWRMLEYGMLIDQTYQQTLLIQQVLYVGQERLNMPYQLIRESRLYYEYQLIDIRQIDCQPLLHSPAMADNILAILCRIENNQTQVVKQILSKIGQLEGKARQDALERLCILTGLRSLTLQDLVRRESETMPIVVDMGNTLFGKELVERGRLEGEQKGRLEGKLEGEVLLLQRQLKKRFGPLPQWVIERIHRADSEQLEDWSLRVLEAKKLEDVLD